MGSTADDVRIRRAALDHCESLRARWGDHVPARELATFPFDNTTIHLRGQQGIFRPKELHDGPLSLRSTLTSSYNDAVLHGGQEIEYDFAPLGNEHQNHELRALSGTATPLIYLVQVADKGSGVEYLIVSPVFVRGFDPTRRVFFVTYQPVQDEIETSTFGELSTVDEIAKRYGVRMLKSRLHQAHFRKSVLQAYRNRCAVCELAVRPLLDGAHIIRDVDEEGAAAVRNGLGLCALHHRAYDTKVLRIRPDYSIAIDTEEIGASDSAAERNLLAYQDRTIRVPRDERLRPEPWRLERALGA